MIRIWIIFSFFRLSIPFAHAGAEVGLSMMYSNAIQDSLPFDIFLKKSWSPNPTARFVKLHMYFDQPTPMGEVEVDTCGTIKINENIKNSVSAYINFNEGTIESRADDSDQVESGVKQSPGGKLVIAKNEFDTISAVRSLTFNFGKNVGFKICGISFKDKSGNLISVKVPRAIAGTLEASSTLAPTTSYDPSFLFDSRFEYGWASNHEPKGVSLIFNFAEDQKIEKINLWNGYQRSFIHCTANSRAKKIMLTGDNHYAAEITVQDVLGSQLLVLPKPFLGKNLKLTVADAYSGKSYKDLVISELRFYDGKDWLMLNPLPQLKKIVDENTQQFESAGVRPLLNNSFSGADSEKSGSMRLSRHFVVRLRSDGSMYMSRASESNDPDMTNFDGDFFALGNFEIKAAAKASGLKLRIFGLHYPQASYSGDCNGCGRDCNQAVSDANEKIFQETLTIKSIDANTFEMLNPTGGKTIKFSKLKLQRE